MTEGTFIIGAFIIVATVIGVAVSPRQEMAVAAGIGGGALAALVAWLIVFRLLFGVAS